MGMNIGVAAEAVELELDIVDGDVLEMLDHAEELMALNAEIEELDDLIMFAENVDAILDTVNEHGIDSAVEALVGEDMAGLDEMVWDAEDLEGTVEALNKKSQSFGSRVMAAIKRIIEKLKQMFEKLWYNEKMTRAAVTKQVVRVRGIKKPEWKKAKTFNDGATKAYTKALNASVKAADKVIRALESTEFNLSANADVDALISGSAIKSLRAASKKTIPYDTSKVTAAKAVKEMDSRHAEAKAAFDDLRSSHKVVKSIKIKYVVVKEQATFSVTRKSGKNAYQPAKAASAASTLFGYASISALKELRFIANVLKNVK